MSDRRAPFSGPLARGAGKELAIAGIPWVLAVVAVFRWPSLVTAILALLLTLLVVLLLYFFRNPQRALPQEADVFLSPADGEIVSIERHTTAPAYIEGDALEISIFMSIFDVHVNRAPAEGRVALVEHVPGQFVKAFRPEASEINEHNLIGLDTRFGKVLVKQVAGILARRIVCWVRPGQALQAGQRLGVIKFGSRVDLYLPADAQVAVELGDHVHAGSTIVARWTGRSAH